MFELVIRGPVAPPSLASASISGDEPGPWLERALALTDNQLTVLIPLLNAHDAADSLRRLVRACADLNHLGSVLADAFADSCDEFMRRAFALKSLAAYLQAHQQGNAPPEVLTLEMWCRHILEHEARRHPDLAENLAQWCNAMLDQYDPGDEEVAQPELDHADTKEPQPHA